MALVSKEVNSLEGMTNVEARKFVNGLIEPHSRGFFKDDSWRPVHAIFKALRDASVPYSIESAEYGVSKGYQETFQGEKWKNQKDFKEWKFEIEFSNKKGRNTKLYGRIMASGAGSVSDPLERYDIVAIVS